MAMTSMYKKLRKAMIRKNAKRKEKVQDALAAFITATAATAAVISRAYSWLTIQGKSAQQSYGHPMDLPRLPTYQPLLMHCQTNLTSTLQSTKQSFGHTVNIHWLPTGQRSPIQSQTRPTAQTQKRTTINWSPNGPIQIANAPTIVNTSSN